MEKIIIKNFLIFDDVEMEIKRLNILIGEQASGKSLLAKLVYFFKDIGKYTLSSLIDNQDFETFKLEQIKLFTDLFPIQFWNKNQGFQITYFYSNELQVSIKYHDNDLTEIHYPNEFKNQYFLIQEEIKEKRELKRISGVATRSDVYSWLVHAEQAFKIQGFDKFIKRASYIPAGRSFFSLLENNVFSLINDDSFEIDLLMKDFGVMLQDAKRFTNEAIVNNLDQANKDEILKFYDKVLKGRYEVIDNKDCLVTDKSSILLSKASSGQQEAFPLVLVLGMLLGKNIRKIINYLFIEEPEAHLFPTAQNTIVSAILNVLHLINYNFLEKLGDDCHVFITTHSPYILSAVNNAILANDVVEKGKISVEDYVKMSDGAYPISLDDVSAYSMSGGKITNIKDEEYRMIGGEILDEVSNHFGEVMDQLLELDD